MDYRGIECSECSISNLIQKEPPISRFFLVLYADFSQALYLPSAFAARVVHLAGKEIELEDMCGQRWPATLSFVGRTLSLVKGWSSFYRVHDLRKGYVLVFTYIKGSHFHVQIYAKTACERTKLSYERPQTNNHGCTHSAPENRSVEGTSKSKGGPVSNIKNGNGKGKEKEKEPNIGKKRTPSDSNAAPSVGTSGNPAKPRRMRGKKKPREGIRKGTRGDAYGLSKPANLEACYKPVELVSLPRVQRERGEGEATVAGIGAGVKRADPSNNGYKIDPTYLKSLGSKPPGVY
ncbi:putative B3 domain-containing protein Os03g0621600 isoform X2 [Andrographis paniculata]|uniref:putative B3 domain-containing protein Os03g0621600 isoform X2 n=1 Tax=Andrographis paniculata TaxID=175694 RepID=UPI0021E90E5C|nr:putative B3 domain-containing protein Os03g0621600 isoform X2 [Andrographis paniculata]